MTTPPPVGPGRPGNPLQRLPLPALFVVIVVLWAGAQLVFSTRRVDALSIVLDLAGGVVVAAVLTAGIGAQRRRLGGTDASLRFGRAVRSGEIPAGVDTSGWPDELTHVAERTRRQRWFVRAAGLVPFGLGIWAVTDPSARLLGILLALAMVAGWIVGEISARRTLARIDRMRADLSG